MMRDPVLRSLDESLRERNEARRDRVFTDATAEEAPSVSTVIAPVRPPMANRPPWMQYARSGRWCVTYTYAGHRQGDRQVQRCHSPADLVRFMRDFFNGNEFAIVKRVWFDARPNSVR